MLVAEVHGKIVPEAQGSEDYLTSAVFGHLRYIPPRLFWRGLFARAESSLKNGLSLADLLWPEPGPLPNYTELQIQFWKRHREADEPDLWMRFTGKQQPVHHVLVEVKLDALKGGSGSDDQLVRYLSLLDQLPGQSPPGCQSGFRCLVYLTPRDSTAEVEDSLSRVLDLDNERRRLFRLRWQDVLDVARDEWPRAEEPFRMILRDVADFLERRGLEYFRGFRSNKPLNEFDRYERAFFSPSELFARLPSLPLLAVQKAGWTDGS